MISTSIHSSVVPVVSSPGAAVEGSEVQAVSSPFPSPASPKPSSVVESSSVSSPSHSPASSRPSSVVVSSSVSSPSHSPEPSSVVVSSF